jgi:hypothetical protein
MKKTLAIITVFLLAGLCLLAWWRYGPCASMIEKRVASVGVSRLEADFDAWSLNREQKEKALALEELPGGMQALRPLRAFLRRDGLYLPLKDRFNEEDGVFIAATSADAERKPSHDPVLQFHRLGPKVFRYHKCE